MSLIKQLWMAIALLMVMAFGISFVVSTLSAKHYLEEQLYLKNVDNAASLALSMNQMPKDPVMVELQLSAQFDNGHYQLIRLAAPDGKVIVERRAEQQDIQAPTWFVNLINIQAPAGNSTIMDGWTVYGNLTLESHTSYAYETLWEGTIELLITFLLGSMISGLLGSWILKAITRPLDVVVEQAEAIGGRRFVTNREPNTLEFKQLVRAMNTLSGRVKAMLDEETQRLETMRKKSQQDPLTSLLNRDAFMGYVTTILDRDDANATGYLLLARLTPLGLINQTLGHRDTDRFIQSLAHRLSALCAQRQGWQVARLNGSDFAILAPACEHPQPLADAVVACLITTDYPAIADMTSLPTAICRYQSGDTIGKLMTRVDGALAVAESDARQNPVVREISDHPLSELTLSDWRYALIPALDNVNNLQLGQYAVLDKAGRQLHTECPMRLTVFGQSQPAGIVMPWIARLNLQPKMDLAVLNAAIHQLKQDPKPLCINLSAEAIDDLHFRETLLSTLQTTDPALIKRLWLEIPEAGAYQHLESFRSLCLALKPFQCQLGLEHVGLQLSRISELHDLGLDYIKVDASFIRDIHQHAHQQSFIQGICTVAHAIGLIVIAEGVSQQAEQQILLSLGMDGFTGPGITAP